MPIDRVRVAVSNTGPLISVFQSDQIEILQQLYDRIEIPLSVQTELVKHGAEADVSELLETGFIEIVRLSPREEQFAQTISQEIANSRLTKDKEPANHYAEAEAITLASRAEIGALEILLDERAARQIAQARRVPLIGFAGILIRACQRELISPETVRAILMRCQEQGTHYSNAFIIEVYQRLMKGSS